jgi:hypothetical protein
MDEYEEGPEDEFEGGAENDEPEEDEFEDDSI